MQGLVTVFGGSGFIGRYTVRALTRAGWRVRVAVRRPNLHPELKVMGEVGQVELFQANVRVPETIDWALDGAEACINLVGALSGRGRQSFEALHTDAARAIAAACARRGITRLVQMSALGADANSASVYARTKAEGEQAVLAAVPSATIIRPSVVFGPEDSFFNRFGKMAAISPVLPLIGGGETRFQPVYAGDVGAAIATALERAAARGQTYELGGPGVYSFKTLMEILLKEIDHKRILAPVPFPVARLLGLGGDVLSMIGITPPVTSDQIELLKRDSVPAKGSKGLADLDVTPTALEAVLPTYLWTYRNGGQFAQPEADNA